MQTYTCLHKNIVMDMAIDIGIFLPKLFPHMFIKCNIYLISYLSLNLKC